MRKGKCMQEVKQPNKKPFIFYYMIALIVIILINSLLVPQIVQRAVKEVDYNTFMQMTYDKQIDEVQVQDNQIVFTAKDDKTIYKTGLMDDPDRTQRLYDSGAKFSSEIVEEASPVLSFLISWLLPLIIIIGFGQLMYRQMAKKAGGDSMMFGMGGMGKSNAKVYVKSSNGIKFTDVAGEDEAKENLTEIVEYLHDPDKYKEIGASMPKGILLVGPPGTGKTMLAKAVAQAKQMYRSSPCPVRNSWRCSWVWVPPRSETCSNRRRKRLPVSYLSMRLMPSVKSVTDRWAETMRENRH